MKKKLISTAVAMAMIFGLTGCSDTGQSISSTVGDTEVNGKLECVDGNLVCSEWRDTETGVHYYYTQYRGLVLRVKEDGSPYTD